MIKIDVGGFEFARWNEGDQLLLIKSGRLNDYVAYCNEKQIEKIILSPYDGYHIDNVDFLKDCPSIKKIHMQGEFSSYQGLYNLPHLEELSAIFSHGIDFSLLPSLLNLSTDWNPKIDKGIFEATSLKRLWIRGYKPRSKDLIHCSKLKHLEDLSIISSQIQSINGVENLHNIQSLHLAYCQRLANIEALIKLAATLQVLEVDHCKSIPDLACVRSLENLHNMIVFDTGKIQSLAFIRQMPKLKFLSFVGVDVLDGDMTPCFLLDYAGFLKKRHYSHSPEQIRDIITNRQK